MGKIIIASWKRLFRNKQHMFWILAFPIALGTLFNIAFSNLGGAEKITTIPVAIVAEDDEYGKALAETAKTLSEGEDAFLDAKFVDKEEAIKLLGTDDVTGIVYSGEKARLVVSANNSKAKLNQSILQSFVEQYNSNSKVVMDIVSNHPDKMEALMEAMKEDKSYNREVNLIKNPDTDTYSQYFYNQLAMACLYAAMAGVLVACENQANCTSLAARKVVSSKEKYKMIVGELLASAVFEFLMNLIGFCYLAYVLRVGVNTQFPLAVLALFVGVIAGISFGFFFGALGKKSKDAKSGLIFAAIMPMCFLSGLMIGDMRIIIDNAAPIVNRINPAALIADSFYCLSIFEGYDRYIQNLLTLLALSAVFITVGILKTRRSKYASL